MATMVQTVCPGCSKMLRFPSAWVKVALRCKSCGTVVQVRQKASLPPPAKPATRPAHPSPGATPVLLIGGVLLAAAAVVGYLCAPHSREPESSPGLVKETLPHRQAPPSAHSSPKSLLPSDRVLPRRVLMISVNNYLYANPVGFGSPDRNLHALATRIADILHVHPSQVAELYDTMPSRPPGNPGKDKSEGKIALDWVVTPRPPLKPVIEKTVSLFLESCRSQDHIVLFLIGHLVEHGEEAYFVPLEGDLAAKETLIPLSWLYGQLRRCSAWQKVLIVDGCRLDPSRGQERPGSGSMSARVDDLLQEPPPGVQVWSACSSGQYSYELNGTGIFLDKFYDALAAPVFKTTPSPRDPLPIEKLAEMVNLNTAADIASQFCSSDGQTAVQTPRLTGHMAEHEALYLQDEPLPRKIEIPAPSVAVGAIDVRDQVRSIVQEIDLPPVRAERAQQTSLYIENLLPFSAETVQRYRADYHSLTQIERASDKYPVRAQVIQTIKFLRTTFDPDGPYGLQRDYFYGGSNERVKAAIFKEQMKPARVLEELQERLEGLRKAARYRDKERSPRWQAHYDYILAQLLARTSYVSEYNLMLAKIRKDELPELQPNLHTGWRLASCDKMQSGKEVREMAAESKMLFAKLVKEHPGTPWAVLAKRAQLMNLGLAWRPTR